MEETPSSPTTATKREWLAVDFHGGEMANARLTAWLDRGRRAGAPEASGVRYFRE
jgi:hypothetical protein